jgi:flavin-dependent dehydrogenase
MNNYDVIIIGGGPAGCSAATRLAARGVRVVLLEKSRMPRQKLCGEFVTPECFPTLNRLGVMERLLAAGAQRISKLNLVAWNGRHVEAPVWEVSRMPYALSLSRARFDDVLFDGARRAGAVCLERYSVKRCLYEAGRVCGVEVMSLADGKTVRFEAPLVVDASGRSSRVSLSKSDRVAASRGSRPFALKAHLKGVEGIADQVELYFFRGGYGGLSSIEDGLTNLCFITDEGTLRRAGGDPLTVVRQTVLSNSLARERLSGAKTVGKWVSGGPLMFGRRKPSADVIAIGDAAGMIDPFTGTGIQIAVRSGELAAEAIIGSLSFTPAGRPTEAHGPGLIANVLSRYTADYEREFGKRMRIAGLLRVPAFSPGIASLFGRLLSASPWLARAVLRASRTGRSAEVKDDVPAG